MSVFIDRLVDRFRTAIWNGGVTSALRAIADEIDRQSNARETRGDDVRDVRSAARWRRLADAIRGDVRAFDDDVQADLNEAKDA